MVCCRSTHVFHQGRKCSHLEAVIYYGETAGISLERMVRKGSFSMHVKHFHNQYEIFYLIEGKRRFFFSNRSYVVEGGTLILVDENVIHMTTAWSDEDIGHDRIILYIDKSKMEQLEKLFPNLGLVRFFHEHYGVFPLDDKQQADFLSFYFCLQQELDNKRRHFSSMVDLEILRYFIGFMREKHQKALIEAPKSSKHSKYDTIYEVADYISTHYTENVSLDALATRFFISKYHLCRTFKEITGYGINEYLHIHRIQKAKLLLEETTDNVSQIAELLGYDSTTHFERVFKTYMNLSPLKYRKLLNTVTYKNTPTPSGY